MRARRTHIDRKNIHRSRRARSHEADADLAVKSFDQDVKTTGVNHPVSAYACVLCICMFVIHMPPQCIHVFFFRARQLIRKRDHDDDNIRTKMKAMMIQYYTQNKKVKRGLHDMVTEAIFYRCLNHDSTEKKIYFARIKR